MSFTALSEVGEYRHQLSVSEMPSHSHAQYVSANNGNAATRRDYSSDGASQIYPQGCNTASSGGGSQHNNIQPAIAVHIWIRKY